MDDFTILEYPDERLRQPSAPVTAFDDASLDRLIDALQGIMTEAGALGMSAPQVGDHRQVLVIDPAGDGSDIQVYVNPEVLSKGGLGFVEESCLSVPGVTGSVMRAMGVKVRARDRAGELFERDLEGMAAVCLQHEMDHLAGKLFIDRLPPWRRWRLRARARRAPQARHADAS